jgi:pSer/pThr/pTyr-binding forkhead associated (FHA) protein
LRDGDDPTPSVRSRTDIVLKVTAGSAAGSERVFAPGASATIGRSEDADLPIQDGKISRHHCRIEFVDGRWTLKDLDSRNGTWVSGKRIKEHALSDGETFVVGGSVPVSVRLTAPSGKRVVFPPKRGEDAAPAPAPVPDPLPELKGPLAALPGTSLGELKILEQARPLGPGTFFRALQPSLNRHVLVEVFPQDSLGGDLEALTREVRRAAPVLHPCVLQVFDLGRGRGFTWVSMEFFEGRSLGRTLRERHFLPIPRATATARSLCEAFATGIDHGVPVGTCSPGDAWLDGEFNLKVKFFREPGSPPRPVEHYGYQAPEVLAGGDPTDPRAAVYTVGAILYHLLASVPPLAGATKEEYARRARHDTPTPIRRANIKVSPILARVVEQALAKDPEARPDGVRALDRELQRALTPTF